MEETGAGRVSDAQFRALLEAAPDAMVIVDRSGRIVLVNAQTEALFGYARQELLGETIEILIPQRYRDKHSAHRGLYVAEPKVRSMGSNQRLFARRKDGSEFPVEISLSPLQTPDGTLVSSAIRDVSDRRQSEAALIAANRELEAFSYSVAHDLRAPLRGITGFAHILLHDHGDRLDGEARDALEEIHQNAVRMALLIDALLSLSRVTRSELKPAWTDLSAIGHASATQLARSEPERCVEVSIADRLFAYIDPQLARTLIDNLFTNAWKFTRNVATPRVELGLTQHDGERAFFVRDNGAGFDMAFANKLFVPFQRLHNAAQFPGTGIGLATIQRIVSRHGGRVWAEGAVEHGATFHFVLPSRPSGELE